MKTLKNHLLHLLPTTDTNMRVDCNRCIVMSSSIIQLARSRLRKSFEETVVVDWENNMLGGGDLVIIIMYNVLIYNVHVSLILIM